MQRKEREAIFRSAESTISQQTACLHRISSNSRQMIHCFATIHCKLNETRERLEILLVSDLA